MKDLELNLLSRAISLRSELSRDASNILKAHTVAFKRDPLTCIKWNIKHFVSCLYEGVYIVSKTRLQYPIASFYDLALCVLGLFFCCVFYRGAKYLYVVTLKEGHAREIEPLMTWDISWMPTCNLALFSTTSVQRTVEVSRTFWKRLSTSPQTVVCHTSGPHAGLNKKKQETQINEIKPLGETKKP